MRQRWVWGLTVWLLGLCSLSAQTPPVPEPPRQITPAEKTDATDKSTAAADFTTTIDNVAGYRFWARADSLLWWVRNAPLPVPIVTTGNPNVGFDPNKVNTVNTAGAIGQPGTQILLGGDSVRFPVSFGSKATVGAWVDEGERIGLEASGFILSQFTSRFAAASDNAGSPPLYFPIFSGIAGAERAVPIADPLRGFSGDVSVTSTLQLWGAEGNFLCAFYRKPFMDFSLLAGFRYADLRERLQIHNTTTDLLFGNVTVLNDSFRTLNQFYGGQLGGRLDFHSEFFALEITGKLAVGSIHQAVDIQGDISQLGPNPLVPPGLGTFPGGIFAQSSNIGLQNANPTFVPFSILPSLELKLVCRLTERLRAFAGYDVLYWSGVLRPGNQINHNVNLSQNAVLDPNGVGSLVGPAQPAFLVNRSDFWAQGVSIGLEFRY